MRLCERVVNDYEYITFGPGGRTLTARDTRMFHLSSRRWLAARLAQPHDGSTVIVTHHAPLIRTRPPVPELRALAGAFASDVTDLMGADRVALWIFVTRTGSRTSKCAARASSAIPADIRTSRWPASIPTA